MIGYLQWCRLKELAERDHLSAAQIARQLGLAARTVRKWLKEPYKQRKRIQRASVLDIFKGQIMGMLKEHPYSAVQVLAMLQNQGFTGGITIVKDYIQQIRPRGQEAYLTLSFAPGECAQVDWGSWEMITVGNTRRRLSFFIYGLGVQPHALRRVHPRPEPGTLFVLSPSRLRVLWRCAGQDHVVTTVRPPYSPIPTV